MTDWLERARKVTPNASQTLSKAPETFIEGVYPSHVVAGLGCHLTGSDHKTYIDMICGLATVGLGYGYHADQMIERCRYGASFSLPHTLEVEVAEQLVEIIPCAEQIRFVKTGSEACAGAVRIARMATGRDKILTCYDKETEVLTKDGFKLIKDVLLGELVATLNPKTHELEYNTVQRTSARFYKGKMLHYKTTRTDLLVTPEHKIYRGKLQQDRSIRYVKENALAAFSQSQNTMMYAGCEIWNGPMPNQVNIEGQFFPLLPLMKIIGYFVTEGWAQKRNRPSYELQFRQNPGPIHTDIVQSLSQCGLHVRVKGDRIFCHSKQLWNLAVNQMGDGAKNKKLPRFILEFGRPALQILFDALIDGDGTRVNGKPRKFYSTSKILADDMCELALKIGWVGTVTTYKNETSNSMGQLPIYHVSLSPHVRKDVQVSKRYEVDYEDFVYCITVPNHLLYVRRNGRTIWSGNCGYHGWHDWYAASRPEHPGVPKGLSRYIESVEYNDLVKLHRYEPPAPGYLQGVVDLCHEHGALVIFDEMVCGFRWALGGGQEYFNVMPDLAVFGKAMANGYPLACIAGPEDYMQHAWPISGSFGGEIMSLASCKETIKTYQTEPVIEHLWKMGTRLMEGIRYHAREMNVPIEVRGQAVHPVIDVNPDADPRIRHLFFQTVAERGVLLHPSGCNIMYSHNIQDINIVLDAIFSAMVKIKAAMNTGVFELRGKPLGRGPMLRGGTVS
jgi:glutamate-1-semialdehyde aminotransferase